MELEEASVGWQRESGRGRGSVHGDGGEARGAGSVGAPTRQGGSQCSGTQWGCGVDIGGDRPPTWRRAVGGGR